MWLCPKCRQECDDGFEVCWACGTSIDGVEDPHFFDETPAPTPSLAADALATPEQLVTVTECPFPVEAHAVRVRLESEGVPVFLLNEQTISTVGWLFSNILGGIAVQVREHDLERAREILGIPAPEPAAVETDAPQDENQPPSDEGIIDRSSGSEPEA